MNKVLLVNFIFLFLISGVSAHFVCGEVQDSESNMSSSWYNVNVYYEENPFDFTSCEVSPAGGKYCCDLEGIVGRTWKIGDEVFARVVNLDSGYVAGPVSGVTTGEAYDIFPVMKLKKVINVKDPGARLIFSNVSELFFNASFVTPYNNIIVKKNSEEIFNCGNCSNFFGFINCSFGMNNFEFFASEEHNFFENISFGIVKNFSFDRNFICDACKGKKIKQNNEVDINLAVNFSDYISDFVLNEYVPVEWNISDINEGVLRAHSPDYNVLSWNFSGNFFNITYKVVTPSLNILSRKDIFISEIDGNILSNESIEVYRIPFVPAVSNGGGGGRYWKKRGRITSTNPFVIDDDENFKLGVFSDKKHEDIFMKLFLSEDVSSKKYRGMQFLKKYSLYSSINESEVEKMMFEYNTNKSFLEKNKFSGLKFFFSDIGDKFSLTGNMVSNVGENINYKGSVDGIGEIYVYGVKEKMSVREEIVWFFRDILNRLKFWK